VCNQTSMSAHAEVEKSKQHGTLRPADEVEEILKVAPEVRDYSGAHEKIDPREIALVKKLDRWIMPILWLMYWLNYLVSSSVLVS
jgi:hypothetical protein